MMNVCVLCMAEKWWTRIVYWIGGRWVIHWTSWCCIYSNFNPCTSESLKCFYWCYDILKTLMVLGYRPVLCSLASTLFWTSSNLYLRHWEGTPHCVVPGFRAIKSYEKRPTIVATITLPLWRFTCIQKDCVSIWLNRRIRWMDGKLIYFFSEFERPSLQIDLERPLSSLLMYAPSRGTLKFYIINCLYFIRYRGLILVNNMAFFPCECESVHVFVNTGTRSLNYK